MVRICVCDGVRQQRLLAVLDPHSNTLVVHKHTLGLIQPPEIKSYSVPVGCRPPDPRHGRAGVMGDPFWVVFFCFLIFFLVLFVGFRLWEVAHLFSREISRRMASESCLGIHF